MTLWNRMFNQDGPFRRVAGRIRWQLLLRSCRLDPDHLERPLTEPGPHDFIICGIPRSGTSLLAALLFQAPEVIVSMEPWDGLRRPPADLFASIRQEIAQTGMLSRGRLDLASLDIGEVRWHRDGAVAYPVEVAQGYRLGVKWPGFWRYLDLLPDTRFIVCVRHPIDVITSFKQTGGRLAAGLEYDVAFHRRMNRQLIRATADPGIRRVLLYQHIAARVVAHVDRQRVMIVRFERWESEPANLLTEISEFLEVDLKAQPQVPIRVPDRREDHVASDLIRRHCPAAFELGYAV